MTRAIRTACLVLSTVLPGCGSNGAPTKVDVAASPLQRIADPQVPEADSTQVASDNATFAFDVYKRASLATPPILLDLPPERGEHPPTQTSGGNHHGRQVTEGEGQVQKARHGGEEPKGAGCQGEDVAVTSTSWKQEQVGSLPGARQHPSTVLAATRNDSGHSRDAVDQLLAVLLDRLEGDDRTGSTLSTSTCNGKQEALSLDAGATASCTYATSCNCQLTVANVNTSSGTYQVSGSTITEDTGSSYDFCVNGNTMTQRELIEDNVYGISQMKKR